MIIRGSQTLTWDVENRLISVSDNGTAQFVYDGDGNRVKKTEGGESILYINKYYEKNLTSGIVTTNYYLGAKLIAQRKGTDLKYVHQDHLGGTSVISDSSGNQLGTISYFPFGATRSGSVSTDVKFTGQRLDNTGLYYYNARYYDPNIGRFISSDSIVPDLANPQALNRYSYVLNNPLKYNDPTGHDDGDGCPPGGCDDSGNDDTGPCYGPSCPSTCPAGCISLGNNPQTMEDLGCLCVEIQGITEYCQCKYSGNQESIDNCITEKTEAGYYAVVSISMDGKTSHIYLTEFQFFILEEMAYQRSGEFDPWTIGLDSTALAGDLISIIPTPYTFVGGYVLSLLASFIQTGRVGSDWIGGEATGLDFIVSTITTGTGAIPWWGAIPAALQLGYDLYNEGVIFK